MFPTLLEVSRHLAVIAVPIRLAVVAAGATPIAFGHYGGKN